MLAVACPPSRRRIRNGSLAALILVLALAVSGPATAIPVTVVFAGTLDLVDDAFNYLGGSVSVGTSYSATLVYENSVSDSNPSPNFGNYIFPPGLFSFTLSTGGFVFTHVTTGIQEIDVINRPAISGGDSVSVDARTFTSGGALPAFGLAYASVSLDDATGAALSSDALTAIPWTIPLSSWTSGTELGFFADIADGNPLTYVQFLGELTSITQVPEPGTFVLVSIGLLALGHGRRRRD
jgi:hypothetical protein